MFRLAKELTLTGKTVLTTTTTKIFMPTQDQSPETVIAGSFEELVKRSESSLNRYHHFSAGSRCDLSTGKLIGFTPDIIDLLWQTSLFDWIIVEADGAGQKPLKATGPHEPVVPRVTSHLILVTGLDALGLPLDDDYVHRAKLFSKNTGLAMGKTVDEQSIATSINIEIKKVFAVNPHLIKIVFLNKADTKDRIISAQKIGNLLQYPTPISRIITASLKDEIPVKHCFTIHPTKQKTKNLIS